MPKYQVLVADIVDKYLEKLDVVEREKIIKRLKLLEENPHSVGESRGKFWILKVGSTGYRLTFKITEEEKIIRVTAIEKRKSHNYSKFYE